MTRRPTFTKFPELTSQKELDAEILRRMPPEDIEFSDYGRSDKFQPGWYIMPLAVLSFALAGFLTWLWFF